MSKHSVLACHFGACTQSDFIAPTWAQNPHVQTIFPRYLVKHPIVNTTNERIATPDGDFLDIAWSIPTDPHDAKALVMIFHGLEGSISSHYAKHLVHTLNQQGFISALMHFRGCSHELNITPRAYHSGEVEDPILAITHASKRYPQLPVYAVGFSLGGNMLMNLVAEHANRVAVKTAIAVSSPLNLSACAKRMEMGFSRVYQRHLIKSMQQNLLTKLSVLSADYKQEMLDTLGFSENKVAEAVSSLNTFYQFDDKVTAPLHGFKDAQTYYDQCSALPKLANISTPSLILHAADDPFMDENVIPNQQQLSSDVAYELSAHGGHVGFMQGSIFSPKLWLSERIVGHFNFIHEQQ